MSIGFTPKPPEVAPLADGLVAQSFPPRLTDEKADSRTAAFNRAVKHNFYEPWLTDKQVDHEVPMFITDQQRLYGVYVDPDVAMLAPSAGILEQVGFGSEHPVATFLDYDKSLNAGGHEPVSARLIAAVTVSPSFRRRGVLKHMMTDSLRRAVQDGLPVAVLMASEGGIYGRFGFGLATREATVDVNLGQTSLDILNMRTSPEGRVFIVDPTKLGSLAQDIFADYHAATRGSVGRQQWYWLSRTARWDPVERGGWNRKLRAAVHILDDGSVGGYVTYAHQGREVEPTTVAVSDLIVRSETSRRELWRYLAGLDLVRRATFRSPVDDPTPLALTNTRAWNVTSIREMLWVRVLNPITALEGREWGSDGHFSLQINDPLGIASGLFTVSVLGGVAHVTRTDNALTGHHFALDIETLGSLYLGDVSVLTLRDAGRITSTDRANWAALSATFDLATAPHCATDF